MGAQALVSFSMRPGTNPSACGASIRFPQASGHSSNACVCVAGLLSQTAAFRVGQAWRDPRWPLAACQGSVICRVECVGLAQSSTSGAAPWPCVLPARIAEQPLSSAPQAVVPADVGGHSCPSLVFVQTPPHPCWPVPCPHFLQRPPPPHILVHIFSTNTVALRALLQFSIKNFGSIFTNMSSEQCFLNLLLNPARGGGGRGAASRDPQEKLLSAG